MAKWIGIGLGVVLAVALGTGLWLWRTVGALEAEPITADVHMITGLGGNVGETADHRHQGAIGPRWGDATAQRDISMPQLESKIRSTLRDPLHDELCLHLGRSFDGVRDNVSCLDI